MPNEQPSAETLGEGFAFWAWHRMNWNDCVPCTCERHYFCWRLWQSGERS